jgi:hypothetical protein
MLATAFEEDTTRMTDAHETQEQLPRPQVGAGSSELQSETTDVDELRSLLARARERLSFYEGFDRIIGENVKRSGELMLETITLREKAEEATREANALRDTLEATLAAERQRHQAMLGELGEALDHLTGQVEIFRLKLSGTMQAISGLLPQGSGSPEKHAPASESDSAVPEAAAAMMETEAGGVPIEPETSTTSGDGPSTTTPAPKTPGTSRARTVDALFHGIPDPATALQLQRYLGDLGTVSSVQAREFADGILRLQVTVSQPLTAADFASWSGSRALQVVREQANVIEIRLT